MSKTNLADLPTPVLLIDYEKLENNISTMAAKAKKNEVNLHPHIKTHKCVEAARIQTRGHFGGITVSTLAEARAFAAGGFQDITYAVPLPLDRLNECADLHQRLDSFHIPVPEDIRRLCLSTQPS